MTPTQKRNAELERQNNVLRDALDDMSKGNEEITQRLATSQQLRLLQEKRNRRNLTRIFSLHMTVARLAGYIDHVREEAGQPAIRGGTPEEFDARERVAELLNMEDREFEKTINGMDDNEIATLLGKPDGPEESDIKF